MSYLFSQQAVFCFFSFMALTSGLTVVLSNNPVKAVLSLILTFFASAAIWLMLQAEFLAITLVLVYVGAVMVLFLFVVMMLDIRKTYASGCKWHNLLLLFVPIFFYLLSFEVRSHNFLQYKKWLLPSEQMVLHVTSLATALFTRYLLHVQCVGAILLAAIIAAISLVNKNKAQYKRQVVAEQVAADSKTRIKLIDLPRHQC